MIGIFDSGLGGIQTLHYIHKLLPDYDYIFLADNAHVPYGEKTSTQIRSYTFKCLDRLFNQGCQLVIIACNTAAAYAIRDRQTTYPEKKTLSVTIPGIETIDQEGHTDLTILATQATISSGIYEDLLQRHHFSGSMTNISANDLVTAIEDPHSTTGDIHDLIQSYIDPKNASSTLILGCTHFPIIRTIIENYRSGPIIDPGRDAAAQLVDYLDRHPEIQNKLSRHTTTTYYTTGSASLFDEKVFHIFSKNIESTHITLS